MSLMRHIIFYFLILFFINSKLYAQVTVAPGDIAFIGFNSDNPDQFSFICTNYIEDGQIIYFTDCGWDGSAFYNFEGHIAWTPPVGGSAGGTIVTISATVSQISTPSGSITATVDVGTLIQVIPEPNAANNGIALSTSGDQLLAYVGSPASPTLIACVTFDGAYTSSGAINSNQTYLPAGLTDGINSVALANKDDGVIDCTLLSSTPLVSDFNTASNWLLADSPFTLPPSSVACNFILPITVISFSAQVINNTVELNWITASEHNNDYFTVEKSADGKYFYPIGITDGAGNSETVNTYFFTDDAPLTGINYYRIKQTDFDGNFSYTNTLYARLNTSAENIFIFPNPATDKINISDFQNMHTAYSVTIFNSLGETIYTDTDFKFSSIDISNFASGFYSLKISGNDEIYTSAFVKK